mgnify:CR=1 FL=1
MRISNPLLIYLLLLLDGFLAASAYAQTVVSPEDTPKIIANSAKNNNPISTINNDFKNDIRLFDNRFRIDYQVKEVTMVFFRDYGTSPVVLVRPDGSKLFQYSADKQKLSWFASPTFDMINIKGPMAGPWQALGRILPDSRVMVISDLELRTQPLPKVMYANEMFKMSAYLMNDGVPMTFAPFAEAINLTVEFISTNRPEENNFGAAPRTVATFEDNGLGLDEAPKDAVFTGQFRLNLPDGEWNVVSKIKTPMYSRETLDEKIRIAPNPAQVEVFKDESEKGDGQHIIAIYTNDRNIDPTTILLQGNVRLPSGENIPFSSQERTIKPRQIIIDNAYDGVYKVTGTFFAKTIHGRDVVVAIPDYNFVVEPIIIEPELPSAEELTIARLQAEREAAIQKEKDDAKLIKNALIINGLLLLAGLLIMGILKGVLWFMQRPKTKAEDSGELTDETELELDTKPSLMDKIKGLLPGKKAAKDEELTPVD